jgi:hypothetical protein
MPIGASRNVASFSQSIGSDQMLALHVGSRISDDSLTR